MTKDTGELTNKLINANSPEKLEGFISEELPGAYTDFGSYINEFLIRSDMTVADLQRKSLIDRTYIYQIMNGRKKPGRDKVIAICIACGMDLKQTLKALRISATGELYVKSRRDTIIIYGINNHLNVISVNDMLRRFGEPILE